MADPVTIGAGTMATSAIGSIIQAFGGYESGQAKKEYEYFQAGVNRQLANVALLKANRDVMAGEQEAQKYGIRTRQITGGFTAGAGARNVGMGGSTAQVRASQFAAGQEEQATARQTAAERAYGERVEAAAKTATAGAEEMAGRQEALAGEIGAAGSIVSGVGSVAGKWYDISKYGGGDQVQDTLQDIVEG